MGLGEDSAECPALSEHAVLAVGGVIIHYRYDHSADSPQLLLLFPEGCVYLLGHTTQGWTAGQGSRILISPSISSLMSRICLVFMFQQPLGPGTW